MIEKSIEIIKEPISEQGKVYVITEAFPPISAGSSVLNKNLLSYFESDSYTVYTHKTQVSKGVEIPTGVNIRYIARSFEAKSGRLHRLLLPYQLKNAYKRILRDAAKEKPIAILTTYPGYDFLKLGYDVSKGIGIPLIAYMHDTLVEALSGTKMGAKSKELQAKVWRNASLIFVMSKGMQDLYARKYNLKTLPLVHTYLEDIPSPETISYDNYQELKGFWAGDVYDINHRALGRVTDAINELNGQIEMACPRSKEALSVLGIKGDHVKLSFYANRIKYLEAIEKNALLILALNWGEESIIDTDELGTIFPTKTPEYLASGKLIVVHAPENYFLTQYFKSNDCGIVISTKDPDKIKNELAAHLKDENRILEIRKNALRMAKMFDQSTVAQFFKKEVSELINQIDSK